MNRDEAISILQKCTWLDHACKNIGNEYWEDLRQEFWIAWLYSTCPEFKSENDLKFYCVRILLNMANDKSDRFIRRNSIDSIEADIIADEPCQAKEDIFKLKEAILNKLPMYERVLFKLHESGMSYRKITNEVKINRKEVGRVISEIKDIMKDAAKYI